MASTQTFSEGNGASAGTETASVVQMNWKAVDDATATLYSANPVVAGTNSFSKAQAIVFAGTYNSLTALKVKVDNNSPQTGVTITGVVRSASFTPSASSTGDSLMDASTGLSVNFTGTTWATAFAAGTAGAPTPNATCYTQPLRTQLVVTGAAVPGDIASRLFTWTWTES